jgi:hypothetical protein
MDSSPLRGRAGRGTISRFAIENYPRWIPMAELGSVRDSTSSGKKRIFAIALRPIAAEVKGKAIRRIVIFDNHPDSLRLVLQSRGDGGSDDAASRREKRTSIIFGSILIAAVIAAMLWSLVW